MKKLVLLSVFTVLAFSFSIFGQESERYGSSRLDNYSSQLKRATVDLADRTSEKLNTGYSVSRSDIEEAFLAAQLDASAGLFQDMARGNRRAGDLRDAASLLNDMARRAPSFGSNSSLWRDAQTAINDINRELGGIGNGGGNNGGGNNGGNGGDVLGRLYWRGTVDDRVQLVIKGGKLEVRTISGRAYPEGTFSFTSSLPNRNIQVDVSKTKGRGNVRVVQQPARANDFTAIVEISDTDGGAKEYQLDIFWQGR